jgi:hypothetical protein
MTILCAWPVQASALIDAQYAHAVDLVREHHEEIVALYLELWHRKVRDTSSMSQRTADARPGCRRARCGSGYRSKGQSGQCCVVASVRRGCYNPIPACQARNEFMLVT